MLRLLRVLVACAACIGLSAPPAGAQPLTPAPSPEQAPVPGQTAPVPPTQSTPFATPSATPSATPPATPPAAAEDAFGVEVTLSETTVIYFKGTGNWDAAFDTLIDAFKTVNAYLARQGIKPAGAPMTIYTATDDTSFSFNAAIPVAEEPKDPPKGDLAFGKSPGGRALKFIHRGSYDSMDSTYEAITNFLDERQLDARDLFIEEYQTDPVTTPEDKLVIDIYVPIK